MTQTAVVIRTLAMALWVGGMAALDVIEAPLRFTSGVIDRNQAVGLGQAVITRWIRAEWALGVLVLVASIIAASPRWWIWLVVAMLAVVTVQGTVLAPAITRLARGLDFVQRVSGDSRYTSIRHLHTAYAILELVVLAAGMVVLAASARSAKR